jgi:hypothetical protein
MSRRRKSTDTTPFDTLRLEGSLFVPELLERAASGDATFQKETDYAIPKGLKLHDEYGRAFRIATATWQSFAPQTARADLDAAAITRAFVVDFLRQCLGYTDLTICPAPLDANGQSEAPIQNSKSNIQNSAPRSFPVTAMALGGRLPVIIAPHNLALDDPDPRFAIIGSGSKKKSAHQLAQEFLNASQDCLWAIVTNGKTLRLLRDADTLTRPNFLEFDLETILRDDQHRYADFSALWRILHVSRSVGVSPASSIWESWKSEGHAQGLRVRDGLRDGVTQALLILGRGFLTQPDNTALRQRLHDGTLTTDAYFQQLLRLIYRSLFLFCAEERDLLHPPAPADSSDIQNSKSNIQYSAARAAYATGYSLRRFRSRALRQSAHDPHGDLWQSLRIVFRGLSNGQSRLALPSLGGLFAETQCPDLDSAAITNRDLLSAMRELRWFFDKKTGKRSAIDYRNMGPEELGSVYESLLELVPTLDLPGRVFGFAGITDDASSSGNARKTTGSYYTPDSLVQELIKSALDPVIAQKLADHPANPIDALLSITVCDPSCGSGHFLLAAARRLAEKLAELRSTDGAVRPDDYRHALREVASRCLYGVDINPMAVELCRVALWLETVDPGKPLGFLNHHIRSGNSLLGTTPDLIAAGLPDETFTAIEGDDKPACADLKKRNKGERTGFGPLFAKEEDSIRENLRQAATSIEAMDDSQPDALQKKEAAFLTNETAPEYRHAKLLADLWCAAFVIKKRFSSSHSPISNPQSPISSPEDGQLLHTNDDLFGQPVPTAKATAKPKFSLITDHRSLGTAVGITTGTLRDFVQGKPLPDELESEVNKLASQYRFFHWHIAFPQVFDQGGFDCILGNPPWDTLSPDQREFFGQWVSGLRSMAPNIQQEQIEKLLESPSIAKKWETHCRDLFALVSFLKHSGVFTLYAQGNLGKGDFNVYRTFIETAIRRVRVGGFAALVVPGGLYGGANASAIRKHLLDECELQRIYGLINTKRGWFEHVDIDRFAAFAVKRGGRTSAFHVQFGLSLPQDLANAAVAMDADSIRNSAPQTYAIPDVRDLSQLVTNAKMYAACPAFSSISQGLPVRHYSREMDMGTDRGLFTTEIHGLPVYEGRMINHFDYRAKTYQSGHGNSSVWIEREFGDPEKLILPQWRVLRENLPNKLGDRCDRYRIGFGDVANPRNQRSFAATLIPPGTICGDKVPTIDFGPLDNDWFMLPWLAVANSFAMDWLARTRLTAPKMAFSLLDGLPFPRRALVDSLVQHLAPTVLRLVCTSHEMTPFWNRMALDGFVPKCLPTQVPPSALILPEERAQVRAELDAFIACRVFKLTRPEMSEIMDTFDAYRNADMRAHQEYRTKRLILEAFDRLA